jgi:hypothetical protein
VVRAEERVYDDDLGWERVDEPFDPIEHMFDQLREPKDTCVLRDAFVPDSLELKDCNVDPSM